MTTTAGFAFYGIYPRASMKRLIKPLPPNIYKKTRKYNLLLSEVSTNAIQEGEQFPK